MRVPESDFAGFRAIEVALADLPFPLEKDALIEHAGKWRLPWVEDRRHDEPLGPLLERLPARLYKKPRDVTDALRRL